MKRSNLLCYLSVIVMEEFSRSKLVISPDFHLVPPPSLGGTKKACICFALDSHSLPEYTDSNLLHAPEASGNDKNDIVMRRGINKDFIWLIEHIKGYCTRRCRQML